MGTLDCSRVRWCSPSCHLSTCRARRACCFNHICRLKLYAVQRKRVYYYNHNTKASVWDCPEGVPPFKDGG
jgi:uncharacterized protein YcaQ